MRVYDLEGTCETIFDLMKQEKMSGNKLAEKLGISPQAVCKWRTGKCSPSIDNLLAITGIFQVSLDFVVKYREMDDFDYVL